MSSTVDLGLTLVRKEPQKRGLFLRVLMKQEWSLSEEALDEVQTEVGRLKGEEKEEIVKLLEVKQN